MTAKEATHCYYCEKIFGVDLGSNHFIRIKTKDHIIPRSLGGRSIALNYVYCCKNCNTLKGNRMPELFASDLRYMLETAYERKKKTLEVILANVEKLILHIAPFRDTLLKPVKNKLPEQPKPLEERKTTAAQRRHQRRDNSPEIQKLRVEFQKKIDQESESNFHEK